MAAPAEPKHAPRTRTTTQPEGSFPEHIEPMLATLIAKEPSATRTGWAFEMKWDGVRTVGYLADGQVKLLSRKGRDDTAAYFDIAEDLAALDVRSAVLDGEVVVLDPSGRPNFGLLQNRINLTKPADIERAAKTWPAKLMLFDMLELNGQSLIKKPYDERRGLLEGLGAGLDSRIQVPPIFDGDLDAAMATSEELRLEGVVAKRRDSIYQPGRRGRPGSRSSCSRCRRWSSAAGGRVRVAATAASDRC